MREKFRAHLEQAYLGTENMQESTQKNKKNTTIDSQIRESKVARARAGRDLERPQQEFFLSVGQNCTGHTEPPHPHSPTTRRASLPEFTPTRLKTLDMDHQDHFVVEYSTAHRVHGDQDPADSSVGFLPAIPLVSEIPPPTRLSVVELPPPDFFSPITRVPPPEQSLPVELPPPPSTVGPGAPVPRRITKKQERLFKRAARIEKYKADVRERVLDELRPTLTKRYRRRPVKPLPQPKHRRCWSAYVWFCHVHRQKLSAANPGIRAQYITVILGSWWSKISEEERNVR